MVIGLDKSLPMDERIYNEKTLFTILKIIGIGLILFIGYISLDSYFTDKEYPMLTTKESLDGEKISSFKTNRGIALVEFTDGRKYKIDWGKNLNYEDFPTIVAVLHIGDLVFKKKDSDSISFHHLEKETTTSLDRQ